MTLCFAVRMTPWKCRITARLLSREPCSDPVLKRDDSKYIDFVNDLVQRGLVSFTVTPREQAAFFFVKKSGQLRLIVDGRRANRILRPPPSVSLATPESFAALEVESDQPIYTSTADVADCFHRMRIGREFGELFCLRPLPAARFGVSSIYGSPVDASSLVWPHLAVLRRVRYR